MAVTIDQQGRAHRPAGSPASTGGQFATQAAPAASAALDLEAANRETFLGAAADRIRETYPDATAVDVFVDRKGRVSEGFAVHVAGQAETRTLLAAAGTQQLVEAFTNVHGAAALGPKVGGDIGYAAHRLELDGLTMPENELPDGLSELELNISPDAHAQFLTSMLDAAKEDAADAKAELERATSAVLEHWMGRNGIDEIEVDVYSERAGQHSVRGYRVPPKVNDFLATLDQDVLRDLRAHDAARAGYWLTRDALSKRASFDV